jgi:putative DNA primase/helicase
MDKTARGKNHHRLKLSLIPEELKQRKRWVNWKYVPQEDNPKKFKKKPINPATGAAASTSDSKTWSTYKGAVRRFQQGDVDGIGFILGEPYAAVDLDKCRDPVSRKIEDWALKIVADINTYTEVSPSGTGLHLILKGTLPPGGNVRKMGKGKIEIYDSHHYFTVTGRRLKGRPHSIKDRDAELHHLHGNLFGKTVKEKSPETPVLPAPSPDVVKKVVSRIQSLAKDSPLRKLWEGDWRTRYPSHSEGDLALCTRLALKFGRDAGMVDLMFRKSRLFREWKWGRLASAGGDTYGERTIRKAITTAFTRKRKEHGVLTSSELSDRLQELSNETEIVGGLIPRGSVTLLVGDSGLGKSPFLYQLALCVASGLPFLGHPVVRNRVLYFDYENSLSDVEGILSRLKHHLGLDNGNIPEELIIWSFNDPSHTGEPPVFQMMRDFGPCVVILDTLGAFKPGFDKNNEVATRTLKSLRGWARDTGSTIVGVHHPRKESKKRGERPEPIEGDLRQWFLEMRGARALFNGSDVRLAVGEPHSAQTRVPSTDNMDQTQIAFLLRGIRKVHGEMPWTYVARKFDSRENPLGYEKLTGEKLLFHTDQQAAFQELPFSFRYKDAQLAYGKGAQATADFLSKCIALGILRKKPARGYQKIAKTS